MAVREWEEIGEVLKSRMSDPPTDEELSILEDFDDTVKEWRSRDSEGWKKKYEDNDREWKRKYTERFFKPEDGGVKETEIETEVEKSYKTYDDLFKEEG